MNPRTRMINRRPCFVCNYPYSDRHHLYPRNKGGKDVICLCPNHHRFANILQIIVAAGDNGFQNAKDYALKNFDSDFNEKVLDILLSAYIRDLFAVDFANHILGASATHEQQ